MSPNHFAREDGQEAVEFALSVPLLMALIVGFLYMGLILYSQVTLTNAARVGTSYLVREPLASDDEVENVIRARLGILDQTAVTIEISPPRDERVPYVQVDVSLRYNAPVPTISFPNFGGGSPIAVVRPLQLRADSTLNVE
ncbi:MAG: pilus assembly protein [Anaerolineae bacterium]|nr:pilus assembly protein [Anaerolineae bacterium]